jgi:hypothetical protein
VRVIGIVSMDQRDEGIHLAIVNADGPLLKDDELQLL